MTFIHVCWRCTRVYAQRMKHLSSTQTPVGVIYFSLYQAEVDNQFTHMYASLQQIMQSTAIPVDGLSSVVVLVEHESLYSRTKCLSSTPTPCESHSFRSESHGTSRYGLHSTGKQVMAGLSKKLRSTLIRRALQYILGFYFPI